MSRASESAEILAALEAYQKAAFHVGWCSGRMATRREREARETQAEALAQVLAAVDAFSIVRALELKRGEAASG